MFTFIPCKCLGSVNSTMHFLIYMAREKSHLKNFFHHFDLWACFWDILLIANNVGDPPHSGHHHPLADRPELYKELVDHEPGIRLIVINPPWSLLQFLMLGSCFAFLSNVPPRVREGEPFTPQVVLAHGMYHSCPVTVADVLVSLVEWITRWRSEVTVGTRPHSHFLISWCPWDASPYIIRKETAVLCKLKEGRMMSWQV